MERRDIRFMASSNPADNRFGEVCHSRSRIRTAEKLSFSVRLILCPARSWWLRESLLYDCGFHCQVRDVKVRPVEVAPA